MAEAILAGFALSRAWDVVVWLDVRFRNRGDWADRLAKTVRKASTQLLTPEQAKRLAELLRTLSWDDLLRTDSPGNELLGAINSQSSGSTRQRKAGGSLDLQSEAVAAGLWRALLTTVTPAEALTLQSEITNRTNIERALAVLAAMRADLERLDNKNREAIRAVVAAYEHAEADQMQRLALQPPYLDLGAIDTLPPSLLLRPRVCRRAIPLPGRSPGTASLVAFQTNRRRGLRRVGTRRGRENSTSDRALSPNAN